LVCMRSDLNIHVPRSTIGSTAVAWRIAVDLRSLVVGTWKKSFSTSWKLRSALGGRMVVAVDDGGFWSKILVVGERAGEVSAGWKGFVAVL